MDYENQLININIDKETGEKTIFAGSNGMDINKWIQTLPSAEQLEWYTLSLEHEQTVARAVSAGDCKRELYNLRDQRIHWVNETVHKKWMDTIPADNHSRYLNFWTRFEQYSLDKQS
jgi:hypothetical protein